MCRCTNPQADPEVWFRIVHLAQVGHLGAPMAAYREQTVEIALGPKGAFENGNIGALRRRAPPDLVLSAALLGRCNPKPPRRFRNTSNQCQKPTAGFPPSCEKAIFHYHTVIGLLLLKPFPDP
jgi:hypothetical protein